MVLSASLSLSLLSEVGHKGSTVYGDAAGSGRQGHVGEEEEHADDVGATDTAQIIGTTRDTQLQ